MLGFLATGGTSIDFSPITDALSASLTVAQIASVIGIIIASCIGLAIMWWGARKIMRAVVTGFKTGKISF